MQKDRLLPSITPERWPLVVLIVGGAGVLVRTVATLTTQPPLFWNRFVFTFLGQAAFDFATVLALYYVVRILVEKLWLRRPPMSVPAPSDGQGQSTGL